MNFLLAGIRKRVMWVLINELYTFNRHHGCWDPQGAIDHYALRNAVEQIATGRISASRKALTREAFQAAEEAKLDDTRRHHSFSPMV